MQSSSDHFITWLYSLWCRGAGSETRLRSLAETPWDVCALFLRNESVWDVGECMCMWSSGVPRRVWMRVSITKALSNASARAPDSLARSGNRCSAHLLLHTNNSLVTGLKHTHVMLLLLRTILWQISRGNGCVFMCCDYAFSLLWQEDNRYLLWSLCKGANQITAKKVNVSHHKY